MPTNSFAITSIENRQADMSEDKSHLRDELMEHLHRLENLNPDISVSEHELLLELASRVGEDYFDEVAAFSADLLEKYLDSDIKNAGRAIMSEYFDELDKGAKLLRAAGEIKALPENGGKRSFTTALVPYERVEALDFCKILNRTPVPKPLVKAADAFMRRNQVVGTVFEYALQVMWRISPAKAEAWVLALFETQQGDIDPDVARDVISVALSLNAQVSSDFLNWILDFASDVNLLEYWPNVTKYADKLLCRQGLHHYFAKNKARNSLLQQLDFMQKNNLLDDERLLNWVRRALNGIGESVQQFMSLEKTDMPKEWKALSLFREINHIADLFAPIMLVADQIMALPDGGTQLAMASMGLTGKALEDWEERLAKTSVRAVTRKLMMDMKNKRPLVETIRLLTFGDNAAFQAAYAELDLATEKFDSVKQRDKVAVLLAVYYASYRRGKLLAVEIAARYRNLMRMIHDDFLSQHLDAEQLATIHNSGILQEIASVASEARHFLGRRSAEDNSLEEMLAAKMTFERFVRQKRILLIRQMPSN